MSKPLISLCVKFYNQREYVARALDSAFAQTYRPLQIVISDDCSKDGTDEKIRAEIAKHKRTTPDIDVIYEHNEQNLGMIRNTEKVFKMAQGELLVQLDGDDVCYPNRVERIVEEWTKDGCRATVIMHSGYRVDSKGRKLEVVTRPELPYGVIGACATYGKKINSLGLDITEDDAYDDVVFSIRGALLGPCLWIDDCLVDYCVGNGSSSTVKDWRSSTARARRRSLAGRRQNSCDLLRVSCSNGVSLQELKAEVATRKVWSQSMVDLLEGRTLDVRWRGWKVTHAKILFSPRMFAWNLVELLCLLPPSWGFLPNAIMRIKFYLKRYKKVCALI